jgi:hypothetical protein
MSDPERSATDPSEDFGRSEGWTALSTILQTFPSYRDKSMASLAWEAVGFALEGYEFPPENIDKARATEALLEKIDEAFRKAFGVERNET